MPERVIPVDVDGQTILVAATVRGGEEEIAALSMPSFHGVQEGIEHIATAVSHALTRVAPDRATVEFGCEVALEAGHLTAMLAKGSGSASLKITLEWVKGSPAAASGPAPDGQPAQAR